MTQRIDHITLHEVVHGRVWFPGVEIFIEDEMLTSMYGDYMTPPPEDKRGGATGYPHRAYQDFIRDQ